MTYQSLEQGLPIWLGLVMVSVGLYLLLKQQVIVDDKGDVVDFQFSAAGVRFRTRYPALVVLALGVFLVAAPPLWRAYFAPSKLHVAGKIQLHEGQQVSVVEGAFVGIVPTKTYAAYSLPDGTYALDVPKGADGESYQAVVHVSNTNPPLFVLGVVQFDANGLGRFDHTFTRSRR